MGRMLWTMKDAERETGLPAAAFQKVAEEKGLLIRAGRYPRFDPDDLKELWKRCQDRPKARAYTGEKTPDNSASSTGRSSVERARQAAKKLKQRSQNTSATGGAQVVPLTKTS